jgi:hypothetical protein
VFSGFRTGLQAHYHRSRVAVLKVRLYALIQMIIKLALKFIKLALRYLAVGIEEDPSFFGTFSRI